jgi:PhzF family phenazine biosynthesis protein
VATSYDDTGALVAALTTVEPRVEDVPEGDVAEALAALHWAADELDEQLPPRVAYAGAWHLVLVTRTRERLGRLDYDFDRLGGLMAQRGWTTLQLAWREEPTLFHVRNPFPPGGVVEDPATGAAAAAFGAYLRALRLVQAPARLTLLQGQDLGRPSTVTVDVPAGTGPVTVTGHAVAIS